jgi:cobalt-zinc-cadmium efflux system outer membrane protein
MFTRFLWVMQAMLLMLAAARLQAQERLSLEEAVATARQHNEQILAAQQELDAASGRVLQAGRIPNPEVGIAWGFPRNLQIGEAEERVIGISQQIEFPGKRSARVAVASSDREIATLALERITSVVTSRVKKAYYGTLLGQEIVQSLEGQLSLLKDFQQLVLSRFQAGAGSYLDVVRSKVEVARTMNDVTDARREQQLRQSQLNILLGRDGEKEIALSDTMRFTRLQFDQDSVVSALIGKSVVLRIARRSLDRQQSAVSLAHTSYLPDVTVGLSHQRRSEQAPFDANNFTGVTATSFGLELGLSVPLWFWQEPRGQVQEAEANAHVAMIHATATERRVRSSILQALRMVNVIDAQLRVFDASLLGDAKDILTTGITHYRNNSIDVLNLVDIYRTYRATNVEYARALTNYHIALADLESAGDRIPEVESE